MRGRAGRHPRRAPGGIARLPLAQPLHEVLQHQAAVRSRPQPRVGDAGAVGRLAGGPSSDGIGRAASSVAVLGDRRRPPPATGVANAATTGRGSSRRRSSSGCTVPGSSPRRICTAVTRSSSSREGSSATVVRHSSTRTPCSPRRNGRIARIAATATSGSRSVAMRSATSAPCGSSMASSVPSADTRVAVELEGSRATSATRATARAPMTARRAAAASRATARSDRRSAMSASTCLLEDGLMTTANRHATANKKRADREGPPFFLTP